MLYRMLTEQLKFDYVIRFRGNITVTAADGEARTAAAWVGPGGRARVLRSALVTAERHQVGSVLCVQDKAMKQPWCLATSSTAATASALMTLYGKCWGIECGLRRGRPKQLALDFGLDADTALIETNWRDAEEGERRSRARFAQNAMHPDEVAAEWRRWREVLGTPAEVRRFVERSFRRLQAPLEPARGGLVDAHLSALPPAISERLAARGLRGRLRLSFGEVTPGAQQVTRTHPVTAILANALLEGALDPLSSPLPPLGRVGAWPTRAVQIVTTVVLLRLRFKLTLHARGGRLLLAEEADALALTPDGAMIGTGDAARALLEAEAADDLAPPARQRMVMAVISLAIVTP